MSAPLLELRAISKRFVRTSGAIRLRSALGIEANPQIVHAVDEVDIAVSAGEVVALVGESGCGKSTVARIAAGLLEPSSGQRCWRGREINRMSASERRQLRLEIQMIFQDSHASLNPRMRVRDIIGEAPLAHGLVRRPEQEAYVAALLTRVGLEASLMRSFPHQLSGGQRARIGIARALAVRPEFLVCDEALAALDVSIQAQVLNLFIALRADLGLTYLFISHDLEVVRHLADRVLVMYLGRIVESAPAEQLYSAPNHPYTRALLAEIPRLDERGRDYVPIKGEVPSPLAPPPGCHFHPRCPQAMPVCRAVQPPLAAIAPDRFSACHLNDKES